MADEKDKQQDEGARKKTGVAAILSVMGPGILTSLAGMDAGGIATFSTEGASYGFGMLWSIPITCILLMVVQETAARMACATGKGFAALIREQFGIRISAVAMAAAIVSNFAVTLSEFAGIASGMLLFNVPVGVSVPVAAIATWLLAMSGSYRRIEKILLAISCVFVVYIVAGSMACQDWGLAVRSTFVPQMSGDPAYISLLVASIGTTISPYMIFMVSSNIVENDNISGAIVSQTIAWFIVLTTASVLPLGTKIETAADAAKALVPFADEYAMVMFAAGLVGASFLAGLGARRRPQLGRGAGLPRHHHGGHLAFGRDRAAPRHRPHRHHDDRAGHQRRPAAGPAALHGRHRERQARDGPLCQQPRLEHPDLGHDHRCDRPDGHHVRDAGDGCVADPVTIACLSLCATF